MLRSIEEIFPYKPRNGQISLAQAVLEASLNNEHLIVNAPTGFGKTISVLSGLLIALKLNDTGVFYVVRTHRESEEVVREARKLDKASDANFTVLEIRGRQSLCPRIEEVPPSISLETFCKHNRNSCPLFVKLPNFNPKLEGVVSSKDLLNLGEKFGICPYFLARKLIRFAKIIVLPYPYIFNWRLRSELLNLASYKRKTGLVIDECVSGDSLVETSNGLLTARRLYRSISEANKSITLASIDFSENKAMSFSRVYAASVTLSEGVKIKLKNSYELTVTSSTRFFSKYGYSEGWLQAKELSPGWKILVKDDHDNLFFEEIEDIRLGNTEVFFDFSAFPHHNFFANNTLVHNSHNFPYSVYSEQTRKIRLSELKELLLFSRRYRLKLLEDIIFLFLKASERVTESKEVPLETFLYFIEKELPKVSLVALLSLIAEDLKRLEKLVVKNKLPIDESLRNFIELLAFINSKQTKRLFIQFDDEEKSLSAVKSEVTEEARKIINNFDFSIHLSGTLEWFDEYAKIVGFSKGQYRAINIEPKDYGRVFLGILTSLTTKFNERNDMMYNSSVEKIIKIINSTYGKGILYVPSYEVLSELLDRNLQNLIDKEAFYESKELSSEEHSLLVREFEESSSDSFFIAVLGGRASEGINFERKDVKNVIVFGVPFQEPTPRLERFSKTIDDIDKGKGIDFAYVYPAVVKVSQALGRVIRSPSDSGVMVLIDERYLDQRIYSKLPSWVRKQLKGFYRDEELLIKDMKNFMSTTFNMFSHAQQ